MKPITIKLLADKTENERLNTACFIINQIFGVTPKTKVDGTKIDKRKTTLNGRLISVCSLFGKSRTANRKPKRTFS